MSGVRHMFRFSLVAVFALVLVVALSSCSKKDVVSNEPAMNPSDMGGSASGAGNVDTGSAEGTGPLKNIYFNFDSANLSSEARHTLKNTASWLKENSSARIQIEGHCDERGTNEYNMALGDRRANSAKHYLEKLGVAKSRMDTISYGEERPADPGHDEAAWAKNRRDVFDVLSK